MPVNRYEMNKQPTPSDNLVPVFTPPLIKLLQQKEKAKGTPLTPCELNLPMASNIDLAFGVVMTPESQKPAGVYVITT